MCLPSAMFLVSTLMKKPVPCLFLKSFGLMICMRLRTIFWSRKLNWCILLCGPHDISWNVTSIQSADSPMRHFRISRSGSRKFWKVWASHLRHLPVGEMVHCSRRRGYFGNQYDFVSMDFRIVSKWLHKDYVVSAAPWSVPKPWP